MTDGERPAPARAPKSPIAPLVVANAGVLVVFLFGPNAQHPIVPLAYAGAAVAVLGAVGIVRTIVLGRRA